jgi:hypothetical protein
MGIEQRLTDNQINQIIDRRRSKKKRRKKIYRLHIRDEASLKSSLLERSLAASEG